MKMRDGLLLMMILGTASAATAGDPNSLVDELEARGLPSDFEYRKELHKKTIGGKYSGTAKENRDLLGLIRTGDMIEHADAGGRLATRRRDPRQFAAPEPAFNPDWKMRLPDPCQPFDEFKKSWDVKALEVFGTSIPCIGASRRCEHVPDSCLPFSGDQRNGMVHDKGLHHLGMTYDQFDRVEVLEVHRTLCANANDLNIKIPICKMVENIEDRLGLPHFNPRDYVDVVGGARK